MRRLGETRPSRKAPAGIWNRPPHEPHRSNRNRRDARDGHSGAAAASQEPSARPDHPVLRRDVGAVLLLRDARHPDLLPDPAPALRRQHGGRAVRLLHLAGLSPAPAGRDHRRPLAGHAQGRGLRRAAAGGGPHDHGDRGHARAADPDLPGPELCGGRGRPDGKPPGPPGGGRQALRVRSGGRRRHGDQGPAGGLAPAFGPSEGLLYDVVQGRSGGQGGLLHRRQPDHHGRGLPEAQHLDHRRPALSAGRSPAR